ncbi:hypothetical protein P171DRAFT_483233 [Karstenula rhodostoma CBS 690.94]|uniref:Uncharacterized protein n=1 Tax=Karstenula rhodostoma CBS 690.94 TaxID=1392251 RepID=A0A9P4PN01_9PLEO|nr:hypothetical protein P171DRAFT_483233 [Karstenula rhodostoma CBS 690.94]
MSQQLVNLLALYHRIFRPWSFLFAAIKEKQDIIVSLEDMRNGGEHALLTRKNNKISGSDFTYNHGVQKILRHHGIDHSWRAFTNFIWSGYTIGRQKGYCSCGEEISITQASLVDVRLHLEEHEDCETLSYCIVCNKLLLTWDEAAVHLDCFEAHFPDTMISYQGWGAIRPVQRLRKARSTLSVYQRSAEVTIFIARIRPCPVFHFNCPTPKKRDVERLYISADKAKKLEDSLGILEEIGPVLKLLENLKAYQQLHAVGHAEKQWS